LKWVDIDWVLVRGVLYAAGIGCPTLAVMLCGGDLVNGLKELNKNE
jgi:hypothetical protein